MFSAAFETLLYAVLFEDLENMIKLFFLKS